MDLYVISLFACQFMTWGPFVHGFVCPCLLGNEAYQNKIAALIEDMMINHWIIGQTIFGQPWFTPEVAAKSGPGT